MASLAARCTSGPPGKAEAQDAGSLVEGLARGIVSRATKEGVAAVVLHEQEVGVAAGRDETHQREAALRVRIGILEPVGVHVALEVVDSHQGQTRGQCQRLGGVHSHEQGPGQARAVRHGNGVDALQVEAGTPQGFLQNGHHLQHVLPGSDLRNHSPIAGMHLDLRGDDI